jgi:hypothetical protein
MRPPDEISDFLQQLYLLLPQILPLAVVFLIPLLALTVANSAAISWQLSMVFDSLSSLFSWSSSSSRDSGDDRKKLRRKGQVKTRAEQVALLNGDAVHQCTSRSQKFGFTIYLTTQLAKVKSDRYYPGLVNMSGTYCFMNSTVQVRCVTLLALSYISSDSRRWLPFRIYSLR